MCTAQFCQIYLTMLTIFYLRISIVTSAPAASVDELIEQALMESEALNQQRQRERYLEDYYEEEYLEDQDPEVMPGFYQGDMAGINFADEDTARVGINFDVFPSRQWPNKTVPYLISHIYKPEEHQVITTALGILDFFTCINFTKWDGQTPDYLIIWPVKKPSGCWSYVGRLGGPQIVSLQAPDKKSRQCFAGIGRPLHEIMHALGVYHEQSRPDRDQYVSVIKSNIIPGYVNNFAKIARVNVSLPFRYDENSIMHYGPNFFSKKRSKPTLLPKDKRARIGQRITLSQLDCLKLNAMYGCLDTAFEKRKYTAICDFLGLESTKPNMITLSEKLKKSTPYNNNNVKSKTSTTKITNKLR